MKKRVKNDVKSSNMAHKKLSGMFLKKSQETLESGEYLNDNHLGEETASVAVAEENAELAEITKKSKRKE